MSIEKPWENEFIELLIDLQDSIGGKINGVENDLKIKLTHNKILYPRFSTQINNLPISLTIEDPQTPITGKIGDGGDVYMNIQIIVQSKFEFKLRPEGIFDRMKKKLKLDWEFQTGNKSFDRRFYIEMKSRDSEHLLRSAEVQDTIHALDPFALINVMRGGIIYSQSLQNAIQLSLPNVLERMEKVATLAKLVEKG